MIQKSASLSWLPMLGGLAALLTGADAFAVGTPAGTAIDNRAQVDYEINGSPLSENSNVVTVTVAEILDVDVTLQSAQVPVAPGDTNRELVFLVTNTGNGSETFALAIDSALAGDDFDPTPATPAIYFDTDGSGDLSAADQPYNPGGNDPLLAADGSVVMLIVNDIPNGLNDGDVGRSLLRASAFTGTGAPGSVFAGQGDGGIDAVAGSSGGDDTDTGEYLIVDVDLNIVKSAVVTDPFGGSQPVPGAQITYQLVVTTTGTGTASNVGVSDAIPANTTYVPNSMTLNSAALTDAPDADAGAYIAATPAVSIALGDVTSSSGAQTITFSVLID